MSNPIEKQITESGIERITSSLDRGERLTDALAEPSDSPVTPKSLTAHSTHKTRSTRYVRTATVMLTAAVLVYIISHIPSWTESLTTTNSAPTELDLIPATPPDLPKLLIHNTPIDNDVYRPTHDELLPASSTTDLSTSRTIPSSLPIDSQDGEIDAIRSVNRQLTHIRNIESERSRITTRLTTLKSKSSSLNQVNQTLELEIEQLEAERQILASQLNVANHGLQTILKDQAALEEARRIAAIPRRVSFIQGHGDLQTIAYCPTTDRIATADTSGNLIIWDPSRNQIHLSLNGFSDILRAASFSPDGTLIAAGGWDRQLHVFSATSGDILKSIDHGADVVNSICFSPKGNTVYYGGTNGKLFQFSVHGSETSLIHQRRRAITSLAVDQRNGAIAIGFQNGEINVIPANSITTRTERSLGNPLKTLIGHTKRVAALDFCTVTSRLASGSWDNSVRVWNLETEKTETLFQRHVKNVNTVRYSATGRHLVTAGFDRNIFIWEPTTGEIALTLNGHHGSIYAVRVTADGSRLYSVASDNIVQAWRLDLLIADHKNPP